MKVKKEIPKNEIELELIRLGSLTKSCKKIEGA